MGILIALHVRTDERVSLQSVPLKDTKILSRALHFIESNYVEPQNIDPFRMLRKASQELERSISPLIIQEKEKGLSVSLDDKKVSIPIDNPMTIDSLSPVFSKILGFLDLFYKGRLEEKDRNDLVMDGMVRALDPHSNFMPPKVYNEFRIGTKGNFGGLGIVIGLREGELTVISPMEDTPAFKAGIKSKDKIVQIGEESTVNMDITEAVEKLRGPPGTKVSLIINRSGIGEPLHFTLTRAIIKIRAVAGKLLENKKIALLRVRSFQEDTVSEFDKTLKSMRAQGGPLEGLILDLRSNPGGLLDQAIELADRFLPKGVVVKTVGPHGQTMEVEEAKPGDTEEEIPVVVLVDEGSASASEIVAGALQQNNRAFVIGNRTFGKGSVQTVFDLKDGSALKLTIAKYLTANDYEVQSIGINPDVTLVPATIRQKRVDIFEDVKRREAELEGEEAEEEITEERKSPSLPESPFKVTYLSREMTEPNNKKQNKDRNEEDEQEKLEEEAASMGKIELATDFPVQLAENLLRISDNQSANRQDALKQLKPTLEDMAKEESEKIRKAFSKIGVDWSPGAMKGKPSSVVRIQIEDAQGNALKSLSVGESGFLSITVENRGEGPFYQLAGVTQSDDTLFDNLEFPFGKVDPGSRKSWKVPVKIPDFSVSRAKPVDIQFFEQLGRTPKNQSFTIKVEKPPAPLFQYSYTFHDGDRKGTSGNKNGLAEPGEKIGLIVHVRNSGKGEGRTPSLNLKNLDGEESFIEKGRIELASLPPGGEAEGMLLFNIPDKNTHISKNNRLTFDLMIFDKHLGEELTDHLSIPVGKPASDNPFLPEQDALQSPPVIELSPSTPSLSTSAASYPIKAQINDDRELGHVVIFVGNKKVFHEAPQDHGLSLSLATTLNLKKGANTITLIAQDDRELTSRKQWIVWRKK